MDPITAVSTYASIVGLVCNFKQEQKNRHDLTTKDFMAWLDSQRLQELKDFIIRSTELPSEIDKLLKQDTEVILSKVSEMRDALASLPDRVEGLTQVIQSTHEQSDRLRMLFMFIERQEVAIRKLEHSGLFLRRNNADGMWDVPIDVASLKSVYEQFRTMQIDDKAHFSFLVTQDASHKETVEVDCVNRLAKRGALLVALEKLIGYREELDYLEEKTRTRRP